MRRLPDPTDVLDELDRRLKGNTFNRIVAGHVFGRCFEVAALLADPGPPRERLNALSQFWRSVALMGRLEELVEQHPEELSPVIARACDRLARDKARTCLDPLEDMDLHDLRDLLPPKDAMPPNMPPEIAALYTVRRRGPKPKTPHPV